jgi:23S rRNA (pseudouridine1915-N3)-methyltransferase
MKITLLTVGKTWDGDLGDTVADYVSRIGKYADFEMAAVAEEKLADALGKFDRVILLDETGKEFDSKGFSQFVDKQFSMGGKRICFVVGGAYGFTEEVRKTAHASIALSKLTFPHQLVRAVFLEQLYRAFTIVRNEKYHH